MYPDLSYILHAIFGTAPDNAFSVIKTFGLLLVLAILSAAVIMTLELKRKENMGLLQPMLEQRTIGAHASILSIVVNALIGWFIFFKLAYVVQNFPEFKIDPASIVFSMKGNWLAGILGAAIFAAMKFWEKKKTALPEPKVVNVKVYPHQRMADITMIAAVSGVVGAKIFALIEDLDRVISGEITLGALMGQFFSGAGLAVYGGLLTGFVCVLAYLLWKKIKPIHVMDAFASAWMVAYAVGRMGCQFSGDGDWGIPIEQIAQTGEVIYSYTKPGWLPDWLWGQTYPHNVAEMGERIPGCTFRYCHELPVPVFPTPIYEFVICMTIAAFLWIIRKRIKIAGMLFFIFLIFNGMERWYIENFRINDKYQFLGGEYTQAQFIAAGLMLAGIIGVVVLWLRNRNPKPAV